LLHNIITHHFITKLNHTSPQALINITSSFDQHHIRSPDQSSASIKHQHQLRQSSSLTSDKHCTSNFNQVFWQPWSWSAHGIPSPFLPSFFHLSFIETYHPPPRFSIHDPPSSNAPRPHPIFPTILQPRRWRATMMAHGSTDGSTHPFHSPPTHNFWISGTHYTRCRRTELLCQWPTV
jgi:hypothetical protein